MPTAKRARKYPRFSQDFSGPSLVQKHFKDSADVNVIVAHFLQTGIDPNADRLTQQKFGYASSQDFSEAMQNIAEITSAFADLPSETREEFSNDPAAWIDHITTPDPIPEPEAPEKASQEAEIEPPKEVEKPTPKEPPEAA